MGLCPLRYNGSGTRNPRGKRVRIFWRKRYPATSLSTKSPNRKRPVYSLWTPRRSNLVRDPVLVVRVILVSFQFLRGALMDTQVVTEHTIANSAPPGAPKHRSGLVARVQWYCSHTASHRRKSHLRISPLDWWCSQGRKFTGVTEHTNKGPYPYKQRGDLMKYQKDLQNTQVEKRNSRAPNEGGARILIYNNLR